MAICVAIQASQQKHFFDLILVIQEKWYKQEKLCYWCWDFFLLIIFKQRVNDYALYFKTFHSRILSRHPLVNFNSFLNYWYTYASFSSRNHVWSRNQVFWKVRDFFSFLRSSSISSWLIHCSSSVSFFSDSLWLWFGTKQLSNVRTRFRCDMLTIARRVHHAWLEAVRAWNVCVQ